MTRRVRRRRRRARLTPATAGRLSTGNKASLQDVTEILGPAGLRMTLRYAHLSPTHLRGAVERLEGLTGTVAGARRYEPIPVPIDSVR